MYRMQSKPAEVGAGHNRVEQMQRAVDDRVLSLTSSVTEIEPRVQDGRVSDIGADDANPSLEFVGPVAGFPAHRLFVLAELDESSQLRALRSLDDPGLRFLVLPPGPFFPDYAPAISDEWASRLELTSADDALVLVVVTPDAAAGGATVNLLAPVVINTRTRRAAQFVLDDSSLPLRAALVTSG
jgi:flagellar assembly factor FliW